MSRTRGCLHTRTVTSGIWAYVDFVGVGGAVKDAIGDQNPARPKATSLRDIHDIHD